MAKTRNKIISPHIEFVQDYGEGVICEFNIDRKHNPNMFNRDESINIKKLKKLKIVEEV